MNNLNEAIINHAFFRGMKPEHLTVLAEGAQAAQFKVGDVLFRAQVHCQPVAQPQLQ